VVGVQHTKRASKEDKRWQKKCNGWYRKMIEGKMKGNLGGSLLHSYIPCQVVEWLDMEWQINPWPNAVQFQVKMWVPPAGHPSIITKQNPICAGVATLEMESCFPISRQR
jgi:hypothetical protein